MLRVDLQSLLRLLTAGGLAAVLIACLPTEPCACSPVRSHAILTGSVQTAGNTPAKQARVRGLAYDTRCGSEWPESTEPPRVLTDSFGHFSVHLYSVRSHEAVCARVIAHRSSDPQADSTFVDVAVPLRPDTQQPPIVEVGVLILPGGA